MTEIKSDEMIVEEIKTLTQEGKIEDAVNITAEFLNLSTEENYIERLESVIETLSSIIGGRTVIRFLIENLIVDIPSLLENLSKRDSVLRYSFLFLLKTMCENERDLFLPYSEELLNSDDPNVKEANLQLLIFMAGGDKKIVQADIIQMIINKLVDEKDFVVEKAIQALTAIGKKTPSAVTRLVAEFVKEHPENEELKKIGDILLKSIVTLEKIEEIVEEEDTKKEEGEEPDDGDIGAEKKKILKGILREELPAAKKVIDRVTDEFEKDATEMLESEMDLIKKQMDIEKMKLEIEKKEKDLQEKELIEKEKALEMKEKLIEKEIKLAELVKVEIELTEKTIEEKEQKIAEQEVKRIEERLKTFKDPDDDDESSS